ncbi:MAG: vWA domain-containing protein [Verrucomicrobiales bacterium]
MFFANPWGFLALLGVPAFLLIHALRHRPERYLTNTLFLIDAQLHDPGGGRRLRRLRRSAQLWLRLLLVALIAWALAKPTVLRKDSSRRIVLVIDTSASMSATHNQISNTLHSTVLPWSKQVAHTEWIVLSSVPEARQLYRGWGAPDELLDQLDGLEFRDATHDPSRAIALAVGLAESNGRVLFVSDQLPESSPDGVGVLAIGSMVQNVGWCGVDVSPDGSWHAILRNYGNRTQQRELTHADGTVADLRLDAGEWRTFSGRIPLGENRATLTLTNDKFPIDDDLHLIRPEAKSLSWSGADPPRVLEKLFAASGLYQVGGEGADIELRSNDLLTARPQIERLLIPTRPAPTAPDARGPASASPHALTDGLVLDALVWRRCAPLNPPLPGDSVLLWSGEEPLAILRSNALELGFHPDLSNLGRVPSALVLIQRWLDSVRARKVGAEALQLQVGDHLAVAADPSGDPIQIEGRSGQQLLDPAALVRLRVSDRPGELSMRQGNVSLMEGAVNFFDPIESDFSRAGAGFIPPTEPTTVVRGASRPDNLGVLSLLLAMAVLLLTWSFPEFRPNPQRP